jgi:hypothetical protein
MTRISKDISAKIHRMVKDADVVTIGTQTTTASYVDLADSIVDTANSSSIAYVIKNTHGSLTIKYKVMGSIDGTTYVEVQAEASLAAVTGVGTYATTNPPYRYYKVQVIDDSGHGTASGSVITKD